MAPKGLLVGDILEREPSSSNSSTEPAEFADVPASVSGFPAPRRRWQPSTARRVPPPSGPTAGVEAAASAGNSDARTAPPDRGHGGPGMGRDTGKERCEIDRENRQKIDTMSPEEIIQAQKEIMENLNPSLIRRLLARAHVTDQHDAPSPFDAAQSDSQAVGPPRITIQDASEQSGPTRGTSHCRDASASAQGKRLTGKGAESVPKPSVDEGAPPIKVLPDELILASDSKMPETHFPAAPPVPDLDPNDPDFLETLREKYFPHLPADPSKLAWMAPVPTQDSPADKDSPYYPGRSTIPTSALRFDFRGALIPPSVARQIPVSLGLHHHGEAPEAAGYTIRELALLARSSMPAQRCIAFQVLGRILFRLGKGEWGSFTGDGAGGDEMLMGVWENIKEGRVLETLSEAAAVEGGHRGSAAYATEALWLFEKGGWKAPSSGG